MSLESGNYIDALVISNPLAGDPRSEGDDHIRLIKKTLKNTFPNITGAVTVNAAELNTLTNATGNIQAQINTLISDKASIPVGTVCLFAQAAAPVGWTQLTSHNNKALRVVSGVGGGSGGSVSFTSAFASQAVSGVVGSHALTIAEMPVHTHTYLRAYTGTGNGLGGSAPYITVGASTDSGSAGSGIAHTHSFTGTAINLAVQYVDIILASRN